MTYKLTHKKKLKTRNRPLSARWDTQFPATAKLLKQLKLAIGRLSPSWQACIPLATLIVLIWGYAAVAQDPTAIPAPPVDLAQATAQATADLKVGLDTMWVMVAAMLVFFMNAGFCMLETGFCRQKNAVNVLAKNLIVFALSTIAYWAIGFGLMFGDELPSLALADFS